jgi:ABC-2 type transport system permease protein
MPERRGSALARAARAFPTLLKVGFAESIAYRGEFLIWVLSTNMPIIMLFLWSAVAREQPIGRFGEKEFGAYFLTTLMVRLVTGSWVVWEMNYEIRRGTLARRLLRPLHAFFSYAAENLAAVPFRVLLCLPIVTVATLWLGTAQLSRDALHWMVFPFAVAGGWAITFSTMCVIGSLSLYWESSLALMRFWFGLYFVFSGYTIPLQLFPDWLRQVVEWLPFRFQLSLAVETALGLTASRTTLLLLGVQWLYVSLILGAALQLWRRGLRRYAAFGG